jgi:hypothetical protein
MRQAALASMARTPSGKACIGGGMGAAGRIGVVS